MIFEIKKGAVARFLSVTVFVALTVIGLLFSAYLLFSAHAFYMYALALCFLCLTLISGFFNIFTSYSYYRSYFYDDYLKSIKAGLKPMARFPSVAVVVPVYNEDLSIVKKNLMRLREIRYPREKLTYYILDDSTDASLRKELKKFSKETGMHYLQRKTRKGFKAGALNNMMLHSREEFVAIFDYDEYLSNLNFLSDLLPYFQDKNLSYLQTEKKYYCSNFFSDTINLFDAFFFKFIQPSRALNNTAIFAGSCGLIRRKYLDSIGGFPEYIIEDTFFSFESDVHGYKSLYIPKAYAFGKPVKSFTELVKQQWRYNYGDTQFLMYFISRFGKKSRKDSLSPLSNLDYMAHGFGFNYISVVLILFTMLSVFVVFTKFSLMNLSLTQIFGYVNLNIELLSIAAFSLSILGPVILTKIYFKSIRKGIMIFMLNFALAFIRAKAAFSALFKINLKESWQTGTDKRYGKVAYALRNSFVEIAFSSMLFLLSTVALAVDNISGGLWLLWYGILYVSTFFLFYKYG
jgi:cellulose synthase/poly-beta-1,6-N-acetylglucosamine synthase-like glycosyltransferase